MAYLCLSDGQVFEGQRIGYRGESAGELVFTTGMEGYLETLTDPSYYGQIVIQTFPIIGNYGVIPEDFEGKPALKGYVVRELCHTPSNFRSVSDLDAFLREHRIPGICGVDTRQLTRTLREMGVMNAAILDEVPENLDFLSGNLTEDAVKHVTVEEKAIYPAKGEKRFTVVLMDYGAKKNIIRSLQARGCEVVAVPALTPPDEVLSMHPDGVMLSNGPGDPAENTEAIRNLGEIIGKVPVFGICLGHQLTALAMGGETVKLKYGHRGGNQPVKDLLTGRTYITSQNHGYAVKSETLRGVGTERYVNANDGSCEGMDYPDKNCFTVQFHPEACSGPKDTGFLFDRFTDLMGGGSLA